MHMALSFIQKERKKMFDTYDDIMTIEELAEALKIGASQAYRIVRTGKIPAFKEGRNWKITKQALITYVLNRSQLSTSYVNP